MLQQIFMYRDKISHIDFYFFDSCRTTKDEGHISLNHFDTHSLLYAFMGSFASKQHVILCEKIAESLSLKSCRGHYEVGENHIVLNPSAKGVMSFAENMPINNFNELKRYLTKAVL